MKSKIERIKDFLYIVIFLLLAIAMFIMTNKIILLEKNIEQTKLLNEMYKDDIINTCEFLGGEY